MTMQRQLLFWLAALFALALILYVLSPILLPFVAGLAIAYFLDPVADRLERMGASRLLATIVILAVFVLILAVFVLLLAPVLAEQLSGLVAKVPEYAERLRLFAIRVTDGQLGEWLGLEQNGQGQGGDGIAARLAEWLGTIAGSLVSGGVAIVSFIALFIVTPIVAFYMLLDWDNMIARVDSWLPRDHAATIRQLAREIDLAMAGFVRGQGTVCLFLGAFYAIGLSLAGLNFGLLIGIGAGLISFIPYIGSTVGLLVSVGVALVQFWPDWIMVVIVMAIFFTGQFIEGNFLQPNLIGHRVGLHPVWVMFALFAFGYLFGIVGMLLAIPISAAIGVLGRFAVQQYMQSTLYDGSRARVPAKKAGRRAGRGK